MIKGTIDLCPCRQKMSKLGKGDIDMTNEGMGIRIRKLRKERNITREELAEKAEISTKFLYEIESGKKGPSAETLLKLATALSASCDYLLTGEGKYLNNSFANLNSKQMKRLEKIVKLMREFCEEQ